MGRSRPKEKHQHDRPNDTPYSPSDVRVFRLQFEDSFVKGHDKLSALIVEWANLERETAPAFQALRGRFPIAV